MINKGNSFGKRSRRPSYKNNLTALCEFKTNSKKYSFK